MMCDSITSHFLKLGDLVEMQKGFAFKSSWYCDYGKPIVKVSNFTNDAIDITGLTKIPFEIAKKYSKYELKEGDVVIQTVGSWPSNPASVVGKCIKVPHSAHSTLLNQNAVRLKPLANLDNKFLYYTLRTPKYSNYIVGTAQGAASQAAVTLDAIRAYELYYPHVSIQRKIATILAAYDDLIENNLRRIKILEEMAQNIYREWFVNFRFPGHEQVRFVDSPLGCIPEGWEVTTVENAFTILGGGTPSKKVDKYWNGGDVNWYTPSDLTATKSMFMVESSNKITELGLKKSSAKLFPPYSVMMTSRATLGVVSINTTEACTNQGFITCIPNEKCPLCLLYFWLKENVEKFINHASGATFKEISKGVFKTIEIIVPHREVTIRFEDVLRPMGLQILNLQRKNYALCQTRDLLLPKLISGDVDVSELDIKVPEEEAI